MSGFSRRWLAVREPVDHRSRHGFSAFCDALRTQDVTILDLGCGSGSNLRYLHPRLGTGQRWTCVDNDAALLESLTDSLTSDRFADCPVTALEADLAADIDAVIEHSSRNHDRQCEHLVTASALLDLVSAHWIQSLVAAGSRVRASFWLALSYDGRIELEPQHEADVQLCALVNAHQRTDKGFGPALGPRAHAFATQTLAGSGYTVRQARSDWLLGPNDAELLRALLDGWLAAARELSGDARLLRGWEAQRLEHLAADALRVRVGHGDVVAVPEHSA